MSNRHSVLVSVPNTGWIHKQVILALLRLQADPRYRLRIILPTHNPFENNLHHIIKEWIEESREDFWLTIDSDNTRSRLGQISVLGPVEEVREIAMAYQATDVLVTSGMLSGKRMRKLMDEKQ